jgi:autotransporter-associated beta strand protein
MSGDMHGQLVKEGSGRFELTGPNTYGGGTTISAGSLIVNNTTDSATGSGPVQVNAGFLGGGGIMAGAVTVGTGTATRAFLAPAHGAPKQTTLTLQSSLTLNSDAIYQCTFKARTNQARTDLVIANGVTINGAIFSFNGTVQGTLSTGLTLTVINNTSALPIAGTFNNIPDGKVLTVGGAKFQANYEGGDGNDLTLTVVP